MLPAVIGLLFVFFFLEVKVEGENFELEANSG